MNITEKKLKQIIEEEIRSALDEKIKLPNWVPRVKIGTSKDKPLVSYKPAQDEPEEKPDKSYKTWDALVKRREREAQERASTPAALAKKARDERSQEIGRRKKAEREARKAKRRKEMGITQEQLKRIIEEELLEELKELFAEKYENNPDLLEEGLKNWLKGAGLAAAMAGSALGGAHMADTASTSKASAPTAQTSQADTSTAKKSMIKTGEKSEKASSKKASSKKASKKASSKKASSKKAPKKASSKKAPKKASSKKVPKKASKKKAGKKVSTDVKGMRVEGNTVIVTVADLDGNTVDGRAKMTNDNVGAARSAAIHDATLKLARM